MIEEAEVQATRHSTHIQKSSKRLIEQDDLHTVGKKVKFLDEELRYQYNLVTQVSSNPEDDVMCSEDCICFGQQIYASHRCLKKFGSRGG